jgi:hypothetical protein
MSKMKRIQFPSGKILEAPTYAELLAEWREEQNREYSKREFRDEVKNRAFVWSGVEICTDLKEVNAITLFHSLHSAGVVKILHKDGGD